MEQPFLQLKTIAAGLVVGTAIGLAAPVHAATAPDAVGEITLAVGQAQVVSADGKSSPAARGLTLKVGDRIETTAGGHAMVRFVDGGVISVRAGSRLVVESYRYDPAKPQDSAIKFSLTEGVARSITGRGGEAARDRFRLNTPIAAIGVKGTDFVVQALPDISRVAVYQGAVVVSPFGGGCSLDGAGPCSSPQARTLADASGAVMLEVNRREASPQVVPVAGSVFEASPPPGEPKGKRGPDDTSSLRRNEAVPEAVTSSLAAQEAGSGPGGTPPGPASMIWGRWSWTDRVPGENLTQSALDLAARPGMEATNGNAYAVLYRPTVKEPLSSELGRVTLNLREGVAFLQQGQTTSMGAVTGGRLSLDFTNWTFSTQLSVTHPSLAGPVGLQGTGQVRTDGSFVGREAGGGVIAGATNGKATEAGYAFEKAVAGGVLSGQTLWWR